MIGKTLGKRYEIIELIDSGGMALVYKAKCKKTNSFVAVKVLKSTLSGSDEYVNRFKREAQSAFSLDHENIVKVTDIGFDQDVYYMVMEFIDGPTLKTVIEQSGGLSETKAVEYTIRICNALAVAHKNGIIHRDIKPHNVLIDENDNAKITDFGIAKSVTSKMRRDKQVIGSVYYVSPEQAKGDTMDQRSDIYSLGIVLYEMLTGELPYTGDKSIAVALKHINEKITPPIKKNSEISESINNIVIKATSKDIKDRYSSVSELKNDLVRSLVDKDGKFVDIREDEAELLKPRNLMKNRIWKIAILAFTSVVLTVALIIGGLAIFGTPAERSPLAAQLYIPNLVGQDIASATEALEAEGFGVAYQYESSDTVDFDIVIDQSPSSGDIAVKDDIVVLTVSTGPIIVFMPNLVGMTQNEALEVIEAMGLTVEDILEEVNEEALSGTVTSQVPTAESSILEETAVTIVIAKQSTEDDGIVPNMVDSLLEQAVSNLYDAGFINIFVFQDESEALPGTVLIQAPEHGEPAQFDRDIDLTISQFTDLINVGYLTDEIEIEDAESKVKIVFEETINDHLTNFIVREMLADVGTLTIDFEMRGLQGGIKKVKVFINNILAYEYDIIFIERSDNAEG
ncbi:MAG: protein kinase [Clostridia bacterium]|jgi:eukaryotic-like serine/threonine-protein kinase|nr:protein kinase [Clostridia bacterium]MBT7121385.1 protein kinase [Clostridia bacterium]